MKAFYFFFFFFSTSFIFSSCRKDKVQPLPPQTCVDTVYFSSQILPLFQSNCAGCHSVGNGQIMELTNHAQIFPKAEDCYNSMTASGGFSLMPKGGPALSDSLVELFNCWIVQGKQNN